MFHHSGKKLKVTAYILAAIFAAAGIAGGYVFISGRGGTLPGVACIAGGLALAWVSGLALYGFGEMVEKTKDNNYLLSRIAAHTKDLHDERMRG